MYREEEIQITIDEEGRATVEYLGGVEGKGCVEATRFLEEGLGVTKARELKPEYHRRAKVEEKRKLGRGR